METENKHIQDIFYGSAVDNIAVETTKVEKRLDGTIVVQIDGKNKHLATIQFMPAWHKHEFKLCTSDGEALRCCKTCGKTSRLEAGRRYWVNIAEGE